MVLNFSKGDLVGAIVEYDRALTIEPKLADAYLNRGKAKRAGGDLDGAIADYEIVCELEPPLALNNHDITEAYLNRGYIRSIAWILMGLSLTLIALLLSVRTTPKLISNADGRF